MKNHKLITKLFFVCIIFLGYTSCSSDDNDIKNASIPLFEESNLSIIHGDSEKSWRITEFINDFHDPNYHLEIELPCLADDLYTFHKSNNQFSVNLGEERCFGINNDGVFTADTEIFDGELLYMDGFRGYTIYLRFSRGFSNEEGTAGGVSIRYFALAELSENRMVFFREGAAFVGEYKEALVFEKY